MNKVLTGSKVIISISGKPVTYAHSAEYSMTTYPIETQNLCLLLYKLGVRSARKYRRMVWVMPLEET